MDESGTVGGAKAISLFSGLGGLDIGLHRAGIETVACVEKDPTAARSLRINSAVHNDTPCQPRIEPSPRYPWIVIEDDIRELSVESILSAADTRQGEIDLVVGGPPCQTFSRSNEGERHGTAADRGMLFREFARVVHALQPRAFLFENVRGLRSVNGGDDLDLIIATFEDGSYTTNHAVLNAANYGVAQTRQRIFILGLREDSAPTFPEPTHSEQGGSETDPWVSAGAALDGFEADAAIEEDGGYYNAIGGKYGPLLKNIPKGANYQHFSERKYDPEAEEYVDREGAELEEQRFQWRSRHWNYLLKMDPERPSWTIQAAPGTTVGPFHWRSRKLSFLEQMRLMDLPLDYYVAGHPTEIQEQIGNAVPPGLAQAVVEHLCAVGGIELAPSVAAHDTTPDRPEPASPDHQPLRIRVDSETSPWEMADQLLEVVQSKGVVVARGRQHAIPHLLDAIEIARQQTAHKLHIQMEEHLEDGSIGEHKLSALEATVVTDSAEITLPA